MKLNDIFPDVLRLEVSALCNFNCKHCANGQKHPKGRGLMTDLVFEELTQQFELKSYVPRVAVLYHGGEPLLNNKLPKYIRWFVNRGTKKVKIVSNGSLMTEEKAKSIIDAGITDVDFSFDGVSPEENDRIRTNGNFERDKKNVLEFLKYMPKEGIKVRISNVQIGGGW